MTSRVMPSASSSCASQATVVRQGIAAVEHSTERLGGRGNARPRAVRTAEKTSLPEAAAVENHQASPNVR
jgi:hypothetical protein